MRSKAIFIALNLFLWSPPGFTAPYTLPSGQSLSRGPISSPQSSSLFSANPAAISIGVKNRNSLGIGALSSMGAGIEQTALSGIQNTFTRFNIDSRKELTPTEVDGLKPTYDQRFRLASEEAYLVQYNFLVQSPFMPMIFNFDTLGGVAAVNIRASVQNQVSLLYKPIVYNPLSRRMSSGSAFYSKNANLIETSLSYSRKIFDFFSDTNVAGNGLYIAGRINYLQIGLRKSFLPVYEYRKIDYLSYDEFKKPSSLKTVASFDLGAIVQYDNFTYGISIEDVNVSSIDYESFDSTSCSSSSLVHSPISCELAQTFSDEIDLNETYTLYPKVTVEFGVTDTSQRWSFSTYHQVNPRLDFFGNPRQDSGFSLSFQPLDKIYPSYRAGIHKNLVGTKLSYLGLGFSALRIFHLDLAYGLESSGLRSKPYPRKLALNAGVNVEF
ncbi:MAG: conjugal transfer protein TraF [Gammaproteobacteria bacterium]|nr:conjugal transfer protein TraF [Gammaproteobacteria bacterium]MDH5693591.1 conjugal transfer protein TraF [Gammaproteobacteria bacterium]